MATRKAKPVSKGKKLGKVKPLTARMLKRVTLQRQFK